MGYKENPKTKGSGILCAIPQTGICPNKCDDCFFQSGRSYLEPLDENLPNMPEFGSRQVIRINDGNDSNVEKYYTEKRTAAYQHKFYNTAILKLDFDAPVVLTVNPGKMTDNDFHIIYNPAKDNATKTGAPKNLMFVRFRCNAWNLDLADRVVRFYTELEIPVVLTFMAYHNIEDIHHQWTHCYIERKRTLNSYWAITTVKWRSIMKRYENNKWVHSCGKIEGELGDTHCRFCGNCLREYFATRCRMEG